MQCCLVPGRLIISESETGYLPRKLPLMLLDCMLPKRPQRGKRAMKVGIKGQKVKETQLQYCFHFSILLCKP